MTADRTELLSKSIIDTAPYATAGQYVIADTQIPGFCLRIGKQTKTFTLRRGFRGKNCQRALGLAACRGKRSKPLVTVADARKAAYALIAEFDKGIDPKVEAVRAREAERVEREHGMTLREAIALFDASSAKGRRGQARAAETQRRYGQFVKAGYLASWMDRPLRSITRTEAYDRHRAISVEIVAGKYSGDKAGRALPERKTGKTTADDAFRWFRAIWNRAMRADETLPVCPTINVEWNNVKAERTAIPSTTLATWHQGVQEIPNPIRRDYLLFVLFSGLRRRSASAVRWEHVDYVRKVLHIPKPKGGEDRAFDLPLSDYLLKLLKARQDGNPELVELQMIPEESLEWVFPAYGASGHIAEPRTEIPGVSFTIHDLRRTFVTVAESLDLSPYVIGALVNHRQPDGSVTAGYVAHEVERLRGPMQQITDKLLALTQPPAPADNVVPMKRRA